MEKPQLKIKNEPFIGTVVNPNLKLEGHLKYRLQSLGRIFNFCRKFMKILNLNCEGDKEFIKCFYGVQNVFMILTFNVGV